MDATPHLVLGAAIGAHTRRPVMALTLAWASHFVLDTVPHFNVAWMNGMGRLALIDTGLGLLLTGIIIWRVGHWWPLAGAIVAMLPDVPGLKEGWEEPVSRLIPHGTWDLPWGVLPEVCVAILAFLWAMTAAPRAVMQ